MLRLWSLQGSSSNIKRLENLEKFREVENKEQTAQKELVHFRRRSKPLEGDWRIAKETREIEKKGKPLERT